MNDGSRTDVENYPVLHLLVAAVMYYFVLIEMRCIRLYLDKRKLRPLYYKTRSKVSLGLKLMLSLSLP
jgi:hypothetical protein